MARVRHLTFVAVIAVGAIAGAAALQRASRPPSPAVLDCPDEVDLGEQELGAVAVGRLTLTNRGGTPLLVENVSTNCSCTGLEEERDGGYTRVNRLVVGPGEAVLLVIRVSVRGFPIGSRGSTTVSFDTSDLTQPHYTISAIVARVKGGVHTVPDTAVFGTAPVGTEHQRVVHLFDDAVEPREVEAVTSSDPARVRAEVRPPDRANCTVPVTGRHIADVVIHARGDAAGELDATLRVSLRGQQRPPDAIRVVGRFVSDLDVAPAAVRLPLRSGDGDVYEVGCICRSPTSTPFTLVASSSGVAVNLAGGDQSKPVHSFRLTADRPTTAVQTTVTLTATFADGKTAVAVVPVGVRPSEDRP